MVKHPFCFCGFSQSLVIFWMVCLYISSSCAVIPLALVSEHIKSKVDNNIVKLSFKAYVCFLDDHFAEELKYVKYSGFLTLLNILNLTFKCASLFISFPLYIQFTEKNLINMIDNC